MVCAFTGATAVAILQARSDAHCDVAETRRTASALLSKLRACRHAERFLVAAERALKARHNLLAWCALAPAKTT